MVIIKLLAVSMKKSILKGILTLCCMAIMLIFVLPKTAVAYTLETGVLTVTKSEMETNYTTPPAPWYEYRTSVTSVVITGNPEKIGRNAFSECTNLTSITIPASVTKIIDHAFYNCSSLESVTLLGVPNSIAEKSFEGAGPSTSKIKIYVPVAFLSSDLYTKVNWKPSNYEWASYSISGTTLTINDDRYITENYASADEVPWYSSVSSIDTVVINCEPTSIGTYAFSGLSGISSFTVPDSVTSVGNNAFSGDSGLGTFTLTNKNTILSDLIDRRWKQYRCQNIDSSGRLAGGRQAQ